MRFSTLFVLALLLATFGCHHTNPPIAVPSSDSEYMDVTAGMTLSVTVPYLRGGGFVPKFDAVHENGKTITMTANDLIGFQVSHYAVQARANGRVRLKFRAAETTRDGQVSAEEGRPALPLVLPGKDCYLRLIYFVRSSQADHNMALVSSNDLNALTDFTKQMRRDPKVCLAGEKLSCIWIPTGVAVKAE